MFRLLRMMRLNIQFIFIFDGPGRPWKRGGTAGRIDWKEIDLLRKLLDNLCIPHHRAPAEAEAECARLQELGIVDGVYSDDSDTLMFGCTLLIRDHRLGEGKSAKKSDTHVRVYRASKIYERYGLDRSGLVMFALLSGGDYDTKGLEGCGAVAAHHAAKYYNGRLSKMLMGVPLRDLDLWAEELRQYFQHSASRGVFVPPGYPRDLHVKNYRSPRVSTPEQCHSLRGLQHGWNKEIEEGKLRLFLRQRFGIWTKGYIKHVIPVLLVKALANTASDEVGNNAVFDIKLVPRRGKAAQEATLDRKITFNPQVCTNLDLKTQPDGPDGEDWTKFIGKDGIEFDPLMRVETETLDCILERGLGTEVMEVLLEEASQPVSRKRKSKAANDDREEAHEATKPAPKKRKSKAAINGQEDTKPKTNPTFIKSKVKTAPAAQSEVYSDMFRPTAALTTDKIKSKSQDPAEAGASLSAAASKERQERWTNSYPASDVNCNQLSSDQPPTRPSGFRMPAALARLSSFKDINTINELPTAPRAFTSANAAVVFDLVSDDEKRQLQTASPLHSSKAKSKPTKKTPSPVTGLPTQEENRDRWDKLTLSLRKLDDEFSKLVTSYKETTELFREKSRDGGVSASTTALHDGLKQSQIRLRRDIEACRNAMRLGAGFDQSHRDVVTLKDHQKAVASVEGSIELFGTALGHLTRFLGKSQLESTNGVVGDRSVGGATEQSAYTGTQGRRSPADAQLLLTASTTTSSRRSATQTSSASKRFDHTPSTLELSRGDLVEQSVPPAEKTFIPPAAKTREAIARARLRHFESLESVLPVTPGIGAVTSGVTSVRAPKVLGEVIDLT